MIEIKDMHRMPTELRAFVAPFVLPYGDTWPDIGDETLSCGAGACVLGKVRIGVRAVIGREAVIRADGHFIRIGDDFHIGENSTIHIAHEISPTIVGDRVAVGRNAVIHACTVGDDCVIEDNVVILDGSVLEGDCVIEAGSTVFPRSALKGGLIYAGSPAKPIRELTSGERAERQALVHGAIAASLRSFEAPDPGVENYFRENVFVAKTARLRGRVEMGAHSSVFFACHLDAGRASIVVGENSNVQDNAFIHCSLDGIAIGRDTTIGHNAHMQDCHIGERSLVGICSVIGAGTTIDDDVLLAAGSMTVDGQHLERGWLWGGRPARPISKLDDAKRTMMRVNVEQYCAYAEAYRQAQNRLA
jgi:gamma-carbonic anhydrase